MGLKRSGTETCLSRAKKQDGAGRERDCGDKNNKEEKIHFQTVKHGEQAVFDTIVRGFPVPVVSWFLNGQKLDANTPGVVEIVAKDMEHKIVLDSTHFAGTVLCR